MPPAVAQAPIVTSLRDCRRTRWMRSASSAVVIEPSTSDRSYGPATTALDASRKFATSTSPASASSSSSQSSRLSWHPSHEANFQTASFLRRGSGISELRDGEQMLDRRVVEDGPVAADVVRPELAAPAVA